MSLAIELPAALPISRQDASARTVPLRCCICTRKPDFSDVSHLLTHVASKSHLSTYYKAKVKSASEDGARKLIADYDAWYAEWNIEILMSERMNLKDAKQRKIGRQRTRASQSNIAAAYGPTLMWSVEAGPGRANYVDAQPADDPPLGIDIDIDGMAGSYPPHPYKMDDIEGSDMQVQHQYWGPYPVLYNAMLSRTLDQGLDDADESDSFLPESPTQEVLRRRDFRATRRSCKTNRTHDDTENEGSNDCLKLKGILWPGMDMFDAATPNMRRKRNQKKPEGVLDRLEAASREIEATEIVYLATGEQAKARVITGFPNSSSPVKGELSPSPPRRKAVGARSGLTVASRRKVPQTKITRRPRQSTKSAAQSSTSQQVRSRRLRGARKHSSPPGPLCDALPGEVRPCDHLAPPLLYQELALLPETMPHTHFRSVDWCCYGSAPSTLSVHSTFLVNPLITALEREVPVLTTWNWHQSETESAILDTMCTEYLTPPQHNHEFSMPADVNKRQLQ